MKELTAEQINRQDSVDNAIYQLIQELNPTADEEIISKVTFPVIPACRESFFGDVGDWMVERLKIPDEQGFYPYLEENY